MSQLIGTLPGQLIGKKQWEGKGVLLWFFNRVQVTRLIFDRYSDGSYSTVPPEHVEYLLGSGVEIDFPLLVLGPSGPEAVTLTNGSDKVVLRKVFRRGVFFFIGEHNGVEKTMKTGEVLDILKGQSSSVN